MENKPENYQYQERQINPEEHDYIELGEGKISGYISLFLGFMSFLAVLCFQYPSYFTTAELRAAYDAEFLREVLKYAMWISLGFAFITFCLRKNRRLAAVGVLFVLLSFAMGGYNAPTGPVEANNIFCCQSPFDYGIAFSW